MTESGLLSAGGPLPLTQAVPGNLRTGPCGPVRPPYGRTEHGRSRGARHSYPREGKGVKGSPVVSGSAPPPSPRAGTWHMCDMRMGHAHAPDLALWHAMPMRHGVASRCGDHPRAPTENRRE